MTIADIIGFTGVAILLLAFALNLVGLLTRDGPFYLILNTVGAGVAGYAAWMIDYMPFVLLEGTWCAVSLIALVRTLRRAN